MAETKVPERSASFDGIYDVPEAARYIRAGSPLPPRYPLKAATLIRWVRTGLAAPTQGALPSRDLLLDFTDLISLRIIIALRSFGVKWGEIHRTERWLREVKGIEHPFATEYLWVGQSQVFAEWEEQLLSGSRHGQSALGLLREFVVPVNDLDFSEETHLAVSWEPVAGVTLIPQVQFGAPCIKGSRIPTRSIAGMIAGGDLPEFVAETYGISVDEVQAAYDWEARVAA